MTETKRPVWMVWRDGLMPSPNTYGPFATREEAEAFDAATPGTAWHGIYDAAKNPSPR